MDWSLTILITVRGVKQPQKQHGEVLFPRQPWGRAVSVSEKRIPPAGCWRPWSHQWKLLSRDVPVSICLCPLIRDLIYSRLSLPGSLHSGGGIINLPNVYNTVNLKWDTRCVYNGIPSTCCGWNALSRHAYSPVTVVHLWDWLRQSKLQKRHGKTKTGQNRRLWPRLLFDLCMTPHGILLCVCMSICIQLVWWEKKVKALLFFFQTSESKRATTEAARRICL